MCVFLVCHLYSSKRSGFLKSVIFPCCFLPKTVVLYNCESVTCSKTSGICALFHFGKLSFDHKILVTRIQNLGLAIN